MMDNTQGMGSLWQQVKERKDSARQAAGLAKKKPAVRPAAKVAVIGLVGLALLFGAAWTYGAADHRPAEAPAAQTEPAPTETTQAGPAPVETIVQTPTATVPVQLPVQLFKVTDVVDGDTIKVSYHGRAETVRLIGIDTPEVVDPRQPVQCFGVEASTHARAILSGQMVRLEADGTQGDRDRFNRLLRYVFLRDGANFNQRMIADGFAFEYTHIVPYRYQPQFKAAQAEAQSGSRGLWAAETCAGQRVRPQTATAQPSANCAIKANISSRGEKIYHLPGQRYYDRTVIDTSRGERWFCSEAEAINAGWRKSRV
jgi:micrococcal nuclease